MPDVQASQALYDRVFTISTRRVSSLVHSDMVHSRAEMVRNHTAHHMSRDLRV